MEIKLPIYTDENAFLQPLPWTLFLLFANTALLKGVELCFFPNIWPNAQLDLEVDLGLYHKQLTTSTLEIRVKEVMSSVELEPALCDGLALSAAGSAFSSLIPVSHLSYCLL